MNNTFAGIRTALVYLQVNNFAWNGVVALWDEFIVDHMHAVAQAGYNWAVDAINIICIQFQDAEPATATALLRLMSLLHSQLNDIRIDGHATPERRH